MKKVLIFLLCTGSTIVSANPCEDAFSGVIKKAIQSKQEEIASHQEQIANYRSEVRLYRRLSLVLEKIAADRSRNLTVREMTTIVTALQDLNVSGIVLKALIDNMPHSERFVLSFFSLLERPSGLGYAAARIIVQASKEPQFKDLPALQFTRLLKYPEIVQYLDLRRIRELPPEEVQAMTSDGTSEQMRQISTIFESNRVKFPQKVGVKEVFTLKQIQVLPPKVIARYISRLPLDWIRALTQKQKQVTLQEGDFGYMSILDMRALGGLRAFYRENKNVQESIQKLRPELNERELFILQNLLSDNPIAASEVAQRYSVGTSRIRDLEKKLIERIGEQTFRHRRPNRDGGWRLIF